MGLFPCKPFFWNKNSFGGNHNGQEEKQHVFRIKKQRRAPSYRDDSHVSRYTFVYQKVCKEYLKCDIKPWKWSGSISLDKLPTDFFDRNYPKEKRRQLEQHFTLNGESFKRVVGYREIMMKREYAEYLDELKVGGSVTAAAAVKVRKHFPVYQYWRLARGGGRGSLQIEPGQADQVDKAERRESVNSAESKQSRAKKSEKKVAASTTSAAGETRQIKSKSKSSSKHKHHHHEDGGHEGGGAGCFAKHHHKHNKRDSELILKHQLVKKWKWPNQRKRLPLPPEDPNDPGKYVVVLHRLYRMPKENQERDAEWLYLTSSTDEEDPNVISHFQKEFHDWMTPGISYESQKLFRHLRPMWIIMLISGRSFLHRCNNFYRGQIEYSYRKRQMILFFLTTILLWTILGMSICSYSDINTHLNVHQLRNRFILVEKIELAKYWLPCSLIICNVTLASFWSLAVILGDGSMIAHYLNCWCAALHELESSAARGIRRITLLNLLIYFLLVGAYAVMFYFDWPGLVRGSCMLTSMLLFRSSIPVIRVNPPNTVLIYQCVGFGIQMWILFCARLVMCLLQIFAQMVKNVCELWNFKFALRFKLVAEENRGELFEMLVNSSLIKLWGHHRLIVRLLDQYGLVFSIGIMCYLIPQLCVFAVALATFILNGRIASVREEFYGQDTTIKVYSDHLPTIEIPYFHSKKEEAFMAAFIFLHICIDFFFTTGTLTSATNAFMTGSEFVRRAGLTDCEKFHERRLIMSLQWSFSPTRLHALTANRYFTLDRPSLTKLLSLIVLIFTLIVRLYQPSVPFKVNFPLPGSCRRDLGQTLIYGICTRTKSAYVAPVASLPPADYYFFMDHCAEIEKNYKDKIESFEYYSDSSRIANQAPFQICRVKPKKAKNPTLPKELQELGRYIQDHGSPQLQETLNIYLDQTHYPTGINYTTVTGAVIGNHPVSTGGSYCGPDHKGQVGESCQWLEYYRDCLVVCNSKILSKVLLVSKMWKRASDGQFVLYTDYSKVDCGINPYGLKFKAGKFNWTVEEPAYNCFGEPVKLNEFDLCSNIPLKEPAKPFTPAVGDYSGLQKTYTSKWLTPSDSKTLVPRSLSTEPACDNCYDDQVGRERCGDESLVHNHGPYSRYWGEPASTSGYYFVEQCLQLRIDAMDKPKANGFCKWNYVEGGVLAGHVVTQEEYDKAKQTQWDKEWHIKGGGDLPPCKQEEFSPGALTPILEHLYFRHTCVSSNMSEPESCDRDTSPGPTTYFYAYRPYELKDCTKLQQIKLEYDQPQGNAQVCDYNRSSMIIPQNSPLNLTIGGQTVSYSKFYGCHGKLLLPINSERNYHCVGPVLGDVCEVDADTGFLLYGDCTDPEVLASKHAVLNTTQYISHWKVDYGLCSALIDYGDPPFRNYRRKLLSEELVEWLLQTMEWRAVDKWTTDNIVLQKHPGVPTLSASKDFCNERLKRKYCGGNSVPLHYPFDGRDSAKEGDEYLCNWEAYLRDCVQPFTSNISGGWLYLPKWTVQTEKMDPKQRKSDPLLNTFWGDKDSAGCDGRNLPNDGNAVVDYWKDECGWIITPEFVDGDVKSLAIMAPILPIARKVYSVKPGDDGQKIVDKVVHCYDSEYAIYRCTHPEISPIGKVSLTNWEPTHGVIEHCYRFNISCFEIFNKPPNGSIIAPTHPEGFCRGYCPAADTKKKGALSENIMEAWRNSSNLSFKHPPFSRSPSTKKTPESEKLFLHYDKPREIEQRLFCEFHCSDRTMNDGLRNHSGSFSSSFHWPMYRDDNFTFEYKFIPLAPLLEHLKSTFGPSCKYNGSADHGKIYPKVVSWKDNATGETIRVNQSDFLGCHGHPLVWFVEEFRQNPKEMNYVGIKDPLVDYPIACYSRLLAGWCEAHVEPLVFMRDDFQTTCDGSKGSLPTECPPQCKEFQGHFAKSTLAAKVEPMPGYYPFYQSKHKYVVSRNNDTTSSWKSPRTDLPYRRLLLSEFKDATVYWRMYKNPKLQGKYIQRIADTKFDDSEHSCFHYLNLTRAETKCPFPSWLKRCIVPCTLVSPKIITKVAQSLVDVTPGQGDMFLINIPYGSKAFVPISLEPKFSFMDCVIDPMAVMKLHVPDQNKFRFKLATCFGTFPFTEETNHSDTIDEWNWPRYPEYLPDYSKKVNDPSGAEYMPWRVYLPDKADFKYNLLERYDDPRIVYSSANPPTVEKTVKLFASPYLACHRMTQEPMRIAVLTALATYWNKNLSKSIPSLLFPTNGYSYDPDPDSSKFPKSRLCNETAVSIYLDGNACKSWKVPSPILRIYGACKVIFPAINAHSAYSALMERIQGSPPEGCVSNTSDYEKFNKTWTAIDNRGYVGFGIKYSVPDMYDMWNSLCHSCAYTREMHRDNLNKSWCGYESDDRIDNRSTCLSEVESANRKYGNKLLTGSMVNGEGIFFKHWTYGLAPVQTGYLYNLAIYYFCWVPQKNQYMAFSRWRAYHPWSQYNEKDKPPAYLIHVPLNALNCMYPCKGPDESEDCNSLCPLDLHNPCNRHPEEFFSFNSPTVGLNYTVVLKEYGQLCNARLAGLGETTQGLGVFGEFGFNMVRRDGYHDNYEGVQIFHASSELIFENARNNRGAKRKKNANLYKYRLDTDGKSIVLHDRLFVNLPALHDHFEVPRMMVVHPGFHDEDANKVPQFSSFCAAFEGNKCEVLKVEWNTDLKPDGEPSMADYIRNKGLEKPIAFMTIEFSGGCTDNDKQLVRGLLGSDPRGGYNGTYCCIPHQNARLRPELMKDAQEWEDKFFHVARNTWTECEDSKNNQTKFSNFGWLFGFNKFARYLSGCPFDKCRENSCKHQLRTYKASSDTNYCTRQFDPEEKFLNNPLPNCKLLMPPM